MKLSGDASPSAEEAALAFEHVDELLLERVSMREARSLAGVEPSDPKPRAWAVAGIARPRTSGIVHV